MSDMLKRDREAPVSHYYLHLRDFKGDVIVQDEEGSDFPSAAAAKQHAMRAMHELVSDAIKRGYELQIEAIIVADARGTHVAAVPLLAALPLTIVNLLKNPTKVVPTNRFEEYRQNADDCRGKAANATDPDDKMSWLKLADAWLQMLPPPELASPGVAGWPKPSDEDSKASH
jgi:hypothetical protein